MKLFIVIIFIFITVTIAQNQTIPSCNPDTTCNFNGVCNTQGLCDCNLGFITFPIDNPTQCNYQQKKQITSFLLALFLTWTGAAQFYMGHIGLAIGQLCIGVVLPILASMGACITMFCICYETDNFGGFGICAVISMIFGICAVGMFIWTLTDLILIGTFFFAKDGNGAPILSWSS